MPKQPKTSTLPKGLSKTVNKTKPSLRDQIIELKGELTIVGDALEDSNSKITKLKAENKVLRDNNDIKQIAVNNARVLLIIVPIICLIILIMSANEGFSFFISTWSFYTSASIELNSYAQAALIIAPIAFIATILGFLLKGVFGQSEKAEDNAVKEFLSLLAKDGRH